MKYRKFINKNIKVSILGFGCMRLPLLNSSDSGSIDEDESFNLIKTAIDNGVNYLDTAYTYHNGNSEVFVGKCLDKLGRGNVYLATKMPLWLCEKHEDYDRIFEEQLKRLNTNYIDFYLAHSLNEKSFRNMVKNHIFDFFDKERKSGRIKYAGFSFHDNLELFKEIIDSYNWDFCQVQFNYMDEDYQAGIKGIEYAKSKGLDIIVMEPVKGGKLAKAPKEIENSFKDLSSSYSMAQWALKWVYNNENISIALSGMSNMEQVLENIAIACNTSANSLSDSELNTIENVKNFFLKKTKVACTSCEYCLPCPQNIKIPEIFSQFNNAVIYDQKEIYRNNYFSLVENHQDSSQCIKCGNCEDLCPQNLEIIQSLKNAKQFFEN